MRIPITCICIVITVTAIPFQTSNDIVVPSVAHVHSDRVRMASLTCRSFEASIKRSRSKETWTKVPRQTMYQKSNCPGAVTYDANFCTVVCQLDEGDQCHPNPSFGDDVCDTGLFCNDKMICQPMFNLYDDSSSSEFLDDLFKRLVYDDPLSHTRRKHTT
jgi:hypothetical protein